MKRDARQSPATKKEVDSKSEFVYFLPMACYIEEEYLRQRDWSDSYHEQILGIMDRCLCGMPADIVSDTKHGVDYRTDNIGIAARVRNGANLNAKYLDQVTFRFTPGKEQEFKKILYNNFTASAYFYGVTDPKTGLITRWVVLRMPVVRNYSLQGMPWLTMSGNEGELCFGKNGSLGNRFLAFDVCAARVQHPDLVIAASEGHYLPKPDRIRRESFLPMAPSVALSYFESMSLAEVADEDGKKSDKKSGNEKWKALGIIQFPGNGEDEGYGRRILALCDARLKDDEVPGAKKAIHLVLSCMRDHGIPVRKTNDRENFNKGFVKAMVEMLKSRKESSPSLWNLSSAIARNPKAFFNSLNLVYGMLCDGF